MRSGANPFVEFGQSLAVDVVERVSHTLEPLIPPSAAGEPADLAIFTSQVAVERVTEDPRLAALRSRVERAARVGAVGPATAEALRRHGIEAGIAAEGSAEALLGRLPDRLNGWRVLFPCGEDAAEELPEGLRRRGARVERLAVYRKVPRAREPDLEREIRDRPFAAFCATSPSAAAWLFDGLAEDAAERMRHTPAVALGPFTRRYLEARGVERIAVTDEPRFASALRLLEALASSPGGA